MNTVRNIAKNTFFLFTAEVISKISLFLLVMFIARKLGDVELGKYSFALAFGFFFTILANFGLDTLIKRDIARDKEKVSKYINNVSAIKFFFGLIAFIFLVVIINLLKYPNDTKLLVYIFGASLILNTFANAFRSIFYSFEKMEYEALLRFLEKILILILSLVFIFLGYGLFYISLVFLIVSLINIFISVLIVYKKFTKPKFEFDFTFWKFLLKNSWPFALSWIFWMIYLKIDIIMLSNIKGDAVVGWYSAPFQILEGFSFIPIIFMSAVFPVMSRLFVTNKKELKISIEKSFKYLLVLVLPISAGIILLSKRFIFLIYGSEFVNSIIVLQILMIALIFIFILRPFLYALTSVDRQKQSMYCVVIIAFLNIILNLILIPILSYIGAAISTLICEIILFLLVYYLLSKYFYRINIFKIFFKSLIAVIIMGLFIRLVYDINLILLIFLSAIIYILVIFLLKIFDKTDFKLFKEILKY